MPAGSSISSPKDDPRRPNKIFRYKPVPNKPTDDPTPEYMNLLGMIFSMCGLLMKVNRSSGNRSCDGRLHSSNTRFLILRKKFKTNHRIRFSSRKFKLPGFCLQKKSSYPMICFKFLPKIRKLFLKLRDSDFKPQNYLEILLSAHARTSQADILHLDQKAVFDL